MQANVQSEGLRKHMLAVEAAMRAYARSLGERRVLGSKWVSYTIGIGDPPRSKEHPSKGVEMLAEMGWPEDFRRTILSHANYSGHRIEPVDHALFACDELCGLIMATALVKPSRSLHEVDARSVMKKMKDKSFARQTLAGTTSSGGLKKSGSR